MKNRKKTHQAAVPTPQARPLVPLATLPALASMLVLGVLIYSNSFDCSFHFDDEENILSMAAIRNFWDFSSWWNIQSTRQLGFGSFALTYYFFKYNVWGWHLFNLLIHLGATLAVWRLTALLFRTPALQSTPMAAQASSIALAAAFLFVAHPLATQSVTYIVQRLAAQAALFYLLSLALYLEARLKGLSNPAAWLWLIGSLLAGISAILTKENAYTLPLAVLLLEIYLFQADQIGKLFRKKTFLFIAIPLLLVFLFFIYKNYQSLGYTITLETGGQINAYNYLLTQFTVLWKYIRLLFIPVGQSLEHLVPVSQYFFDPRTFISFLGLVLLLGWGLYLFHRNRLVSFGIIWFFLTMSIESSIVPIADLMFEHRTYLPSYGFLLVVCAGVLYPLYLKSRSMARIVLFGLIGVYGILTYTRNRVWKNPETLWSDVIKKAPLARAYNNRGTYYLEQKDYKKALEDFTVALKIYPAYELCLYNMAYLHREQNMQPQAIAYYSRAISAAPNRARSYIGRGESYYKSGIYDRAIADTQKAIELEPNNFNPYLNLSAVYNSLGRTEDALAYVEKAILLSPGRFEAYLNRASYLLNLGRFMEALNAADEAIRMQPKNPNGWFNKGVAFLRISRPDSALVYFNYAIEMDSNRADYYSSRGRLLKQIGKIAAALADFTRALELSPNNPQTLMNRSVCYLELKDWQRANADLDRLLAINPDYPGARQNKGYVLGKMR
jgi:tetratricopeptide (TPR) repeat protein